MVDRQVVNTKGKGQTKTKGREEDVKNNGPEGQDLSKTPRKDNAAQSALSGTRSSTKLHWHSMKGSLKASASLLAPASDLHHLPLSRRLVAGIF